MASAYLKNYSQGEAVGVIFTVLNHAEEEFLSVWLIIVSQFKC